MKKSPLDNLDSFKPVHKSRARGVHRPYSVVCIPEALAVQLRPLADADGRSLSNLVKKLIVDYLDFAHEQKGQD